MFDAEVGEKFFARFVVEQGDFFFDLCGYRDPFKTTVGKISGYFIYNSVVADLVFVCVSTMITALVVKKG